MANTLLNTPERRIPAGTECVRLAGKRFKQIQYIGGIGSFWTQKVRPGDMDLVLGVESSVNQNAFKSVLVMQMLMHRLPYLRVHWAEMNVNEPLKWEENDPMLVYSIIRSVDLYGERPTWFKKLEETTPNFFCMG